jgi:copper chaperone CopZ
VLTATISLLISISPEIIGLISRRRGATALLTASQEITINVLDMGCEACSEAVGRALRALPGAAGGMANFREGTASLFVKNGTISPDQIKAALEAVGYGFGGIVSQVAVKK